MPINCPRNNYQDIPDSLTVISSVYIFIFRSINYSYWNVAFRVTLAVLDQLLTPTEIIKAVVFCATQDNKV